MILQGVHQPIPTTPPADQDLNARTLPAPPREGPRDAPSAAKPQTEADKVIAKYETLGKEQSHVYGGLGSSIPNFNLKPANTVAPLASGTELKPVSAAAGAGAKSKTATPSSAPPAEAQSADTSEREPAPAGRNKAITGAATAFRSSAQLAAVSFRVRCARGPRRALCGLLPFRFGVRFGVLNLIE